MGSVPRLLARIALVKVVVVAGVVACLPRAWPAMTTWGTTVDEAAETLPGDEVVPAP